MGLLNKDEIPVAVSRGIQGTLLSAKEEMVTVPSLEGTDRSLTLPHDLPPSPLMNILLWSVPT